MTMLCVLSVRVLLDGIIIISPGTVPSSRGLGENGSNIEISKICDRLNNFFLSKTSHSSPHDCTKVRVVDRLSKVCVDIRLT